MTKDKCMYLSNLEWEESQTYQQIPQLEVWHHWIPQTTWTLPLSVLYVWLFRFHWRFLLCQSCSFLRHISAAHWPPTQVRRKCQTNAFWHKSSFSCSCFSWVNEYHNSRAIFPAVTALQYKKGINLLESIQRRDRKMLKGLEGKM